jgi:hypothetical protein
MPRSDYVDLNPQAQAEMPEQQAPEYWGNSPSFDFADLYDAPWRAIKYVGAPALTVLDTLGRGSRTLINEAPEFLSSPIQTLSHAARNMFSTPEQAPTPTDIRRKYLFKDLGEEGNGISAGDVADVGFDLAIGLATDPTTWFSGGATALGKATKLAAQKAKVALHTGRVVNAGRAAELAAKAGLSDDAVKAAMQEARDAAFSGIQKDFSAASGGRALPRNPGAEWQGLDKTMGQRLASGQEGLQFHIPYVPLVGPQSWLAQQVEHRVDGCVRRGLDR